MSITQFPKRFGKYILLDRLNSGGMAEVYRAKIIGEASFQRLVAIKVMLPQLVEDEQFISMFIDEAKLASRLAHPNIVQICELGRIRGQLYIAMDLVVGHDLRRVIKRVSKRGEQLPLKVAAYVVARAAEGLDFAHRQTTPDGRALGLVHRDVSPQNILISYDGDVKVVDFGIAKAEERATKTSAGVLKGKLSYMSPEQATGRSIDRRADIFSLGTVLYEAIAGKKLFEGESDLSILDKVRRVDIAPMQQLLPSVPTAVHDILRRALALDPAERFDSASDMAEAIEPLLIDDRSIFGAKQVGMWMHALYADELQSVAEQMKRYLAVTEEDLGESTTPRKRVLSGEVFASEIAEPPVAPDDEWLNGKTIEVSAAESDVAAQRVERSQPRIAPEPEHSEPRRGPARAMNERWLMFASVLVAAFVGGAVALFLVRSPVDSSDARSPVLVPSPVPPLADPEPATTAPTAPSSEMAIPSGDVEDEQNQTGRKLGYLTVRAVGVATAKIVVDGEELGYSPLVGHRVPLGKHTIEVVEVASQGEARKKSRQVIVRLRHTKRAPLRIVVRM